MNKIFFVFIFSLTAGCNSPNSIEEEIKIMKETPILLPFDEMEIVNVDSCESNSTEKKGMSLVIYSDTIDCSKCFINKLYLWNELLDWESKYNLSFVFIIEARRFETFPLKQLISESGLKHSVFVDEKHAFRKSNPNIPDNLMLHIFLLDKNNNVVLVGNPVLNEEMEKLFKKVIINEQKKRNVETGDIHPQ